MQALVAVYEEQSFSRAAARENATQSGMSTQVKALEETLGTKLLIRERNRIQLTPAGEIAYREGQKVLRSLMATEAAVREIQTKVAGLVRVGIIPSLTRSILRAAVEEFQEGFPDVELSFLEEYSNSLMRRVLDGDLDFALVPTTELPPGLTGTFVAQDREMLVSCASNDLGYDHMEPVPLSVLSGARLIVPTSLNVRRQRIERLLQTHDIQFEEMLELDGMLATIEILGSSDWVAILPSTICHPDKSGAIRKLNPIKEPPISLDYIRVEKSEVALPRAANELADCLTRHILEVLEDW